MLERVFLRMFGNQLAKRLKKMNFSTGYNTYILAALIILCSGAEAFFGVDIPGFDMDFGTAIATALAVVTARQGARRDAQNAVKGDADKLGL